MKKYALMLLLALMPIFSWAGEAVDMAEDPVIEKRLMALAENLRCLVCQNESLAGSHAELAQDLRREVRELLQKGMSDEEVIEFLVSRYGDFVLYDPPMKKSTYLLWFGPFVLLVVGAGILIMGLRKRKQDIEEAGEIKLTAEDHKRAADLLKQSNRS